MIKRRITETLLNGAVALATLLSILSLGMIFFFVIKEGSGLLSFDLIRGNYHSRNYVAVFEQPELDQDFEFLDLSDDVFISYRHGIALKQSQDLAGDSVIKVAYVSHSSPFARMINQDHTKSSISLDENWVLSRITYENHPSSLTSRGAAMMVQDLEDPERVVFEVMFAKEGGGIYGSLITTLVLIFLTLIVALPFGIFSAIYFNEFAKKNGMTKIMRSFIETLTGVPSIIFGLLGITVFVPLTMKFTPANGSNLIAGALTLSVILLPVIIRTTEEALKVVPVDHRFASLALGANKTQTTFKVVLPQAIPGILTATFLGIGRVIGESAALIFVLGAAIKDSVRIFEPSTSLAVHIWSMMTDEPANVALSSTIALIILIIVLVLNLSIKFIVSQFVQKRG
jgi:phosphate transport system permease protein